jgi:PIN domain nuclease of toxin-antitoxin system
MLTPKKLSVQARSLMNRSEVFVSAASLWEISIKRSIGKLSTDPQEILEAIEPTGLQLLSIEAEHAVEVGKLPDFHKDPFDRMLIAQSRLESMSLLTNDSSLARYGDCVKLLDSESRRR